METMPKEYHKITRIAVGILSLKDLDFLSFCAYRDEYDGSSMAPPRRCVPNNCGLIPGMTAEGWGRRLVLLFTAGKILLEWADAKFP